MCPLTPVAMRTGLGASSARAAEVIAARAITSEETRRTTDMVATPTQGSYAPDCTRVKSQRNELRKRKRNAVRDLHKIPPSPAITRLQRRADQWRSAKFAATTTTRRSL